MGRHVKEMVISDIQSRIGDVKDFIVVDCSKIDAITANRWRLGLRKDRITALTVKNSVAANALKKKGIEGSGCSSGRSIHIDVGWRRYCGFVQGGGKVREGDAEI